MPDFQTSMSFVEASPLPPKTLRAKDQPPIDWLVIDGGYLCWRSYFSTPKLTADDGTPTGAVHGFLGSITNALKETRAKHCVIAWDGGSSGREAIIPEYKANRSKTPDDLAGQFKLIRQISNYMGWPVVLVNNMEADDVIFNLCEHCDGSKAIFTTDKDIISLVKPELYIYTRDKGKGWYLTEAFYEDKWGVHPKQIPDVLTLCGDSIDGIPGVKGVGKKSAVDLIKEFGSLDSLLANLASDKVKPKIRTAIASSDTLQKSREAISLIKHPIDPESIISKPDPEKAFELLTRLKMHKTALTIKDAPQNNL